MTAVNVTVPEGCDWITSTRSTRVEHRLRGAAVRVLAYLDERSRAMGPSTPLEYDNTSAAADAGFGALSGRRTFGDAINELADAGLVTVVRRPWGCRPGLLLLTPSPGRLHLATPSCVDETEPSARASDRARGPEGPPDARAFDRARAPDSARVEVRDAAETAGQRVRAVQSARGRPPMEHVVDIDVEEPCSMASAAAREPITLPEIERLLLWGEVEVRWQRTAQQRGKQALVNLVNELATVPGWGREAAVDWLPSVKFPPSVVNPCGYAIGAVRRAISGARSGKIAPPEPSLTSTSAPPSAARAECRAFEPPAPFTADPVSVRPHLIAARASLAGGRARS